MSSDVCSYRNDLPEERYAEISHNGILYMVDLDGKEKPIVEAISHYSTSNDVWDVFTLTGAHSGPPIKIEIRNAAMEQDEDGCWGVEIEKWRWADDHSEFDDDVLCDTYCDAVRDAVREMWRD